LSLVQPTGEIHLGNYVGAIRHWAVDQHEKDCFFGMADLHALTADHDPATLAEKTLHCAAILLAAGLDPDVCTIFVQGHVPAHAELGWIMECVTSFGELSRMTQFKEKSEQHRGFVSSGLFFYPVLQAADILAYQTDEVPVGEDQKQHIELTREIAQRFNSRFGDTFVVPVHRIPAVGARIMDLQDPEKRMSTTASTDQGAVYILDDDDAIRKKFRSAVTDSGREIVHGPRKAGITNLIEILAAIRGVAPEAIEKEFAGASGYAGFKEAVGNEVADYLTPIRERYAELRPDERRLEEILATGAEKARAISSQTVALARQRMGVGPPS
jgi:tryptophanyl-tRNA synthetase